MCIDSKSYIDTVSLSLPSSLPPSLLSFLLSLAIYSIIDLSIDKNNIHQNFICTYNFPFEMFLIIYFASYIFYVHIVLPLLSSLVIEDIFLDTKVARSESSWLTTISTYLIRIHMEIFTVIGTYALRM